MIHNGDDCIMYNYDFTTKVGFEKTAPRHPLTSQASRAQAAS